MIQFNLLPDVKLEYIKAQRTKYLVSTISLLAGAGSIAIFVILILTVSVWQDKTINDLSSDIKSVSGKLKATPDLDKILTVQGQLGSLSSLHEGKPAAQRLFKYLSQVTPVQTTITDMTADFDLNTLTITGKAPSLNVVNKFTDSLKFTKYQTESNPNGQDSAFSSVVLSSFGRTQEGATYTITLSFNPAIFNNAEKVNLLVPKTTTTRSVVEQPNALFDGTTTDLPVEQEQQ